MSAIAGIFRRDGSPVREQHIALMRKALSHRGPDDQGQWTNQSVGLAWCGLHTTPESKHERQPLSDHESGLTLVADARVDNRDELKRALSCEPSSGKVVTDADLILQAYQKWGRDSPKHIVGAYAFAIWEERDQNLFVCCDHMAIRKVYYYQTPRLFAFATEIEALLALPAAPRRINDVAIADHLIYHRGRDPEATFYEDIRALKPAHFRIVSRDQSKSSKYWDIDPNFELSLSDETAYVEAFKEKFTEAVRCRLRSTSPVGSALSGGIDSSSIVCMSRELLNEAEKPLHTFSAIFPNHNEKDLKAIDERPYIRAVAQLEGIKPHYLRADKVSPLVDIDEAFDAYDDGLWAPNLYMHWIMFEAAQEEGVRVFLDGADGDTTVSHGFELLSDLWWEGKWERADWHMRQAAEKSVYSEARLARRWIYPALHCYIRNGKWGKLTRSIWHLNREYHIPLREILSVVVASEVLSEEFVEQIRRMRGETQSRKNQKGIVKKELVDKLMEATSTFSHGNNGVERPTPSREMHYQSLIQGNSALLLNIADKTAASMPVEPRYPFFDRRLMEFCVSLPPELKFNYGLERYVLRKAMAGILPDKVRLRAGKGNLGANLSRNLLQLEKNRIDKLLSEGERLLSPYVNIDEVRHLYHNCVTESDNSRRLNDAVDLYSVLILWLWLKREHEGSVPAS